MFDRKRMTLQVAVCADRLKMVLVTKKRDLKYSPAFSAGDIVDDVFPVEVPAKHKQLYWDEEKYTVVADPADLSGLEDPQILWPLKLDEWTEV